jgi:hypothetical protein
MLLLYNNNAVMSDKSGQPYDAEHLTPAPAKKKRVAKPRSELSAEQLERRKMSDKKWREANRTLASQRASASQKKRYENDVEFREYKKIIAELTYLEKTT